VNRQHDPSNRAILGARVARRRWAVDTSLARGPVSGIGLYARQLARALWASPQGQRLLLLGGDARSLPKGAPWRRAETASRTLWTLGQVSDDLKAGRAGLFHALANFNLPLQRVRGVRFCLTVHDLLPLTHPESVSVPYRVQFAAWLARSISLADAIICVSAATRDELVARHPSVTPVVIHHGVDHLPSRSRALLQPPIEVQPYVLYLGSLEARKNVGVLLAAHERLGDRRRVLVLAGAAGFGGDRILAEVSRLQRAGFAVRVLGPIDAAGLPGLIARAELLCVPSAGEGFSLPPLEALALGTAVVASDIPAHREILGTAARLVPVGDADALADEMEQLLANPAQREAQVAAGLLRSKEFSWKDTAARTAAIYSELCP
jgi:glycosyltransferase involved in cell wall biosynthesis